MWWCCVDWSLSPRKWEKSESMLTLRVHITSTVATRWQRRGPQNFPSPPVSTGWRRYYDEWWTERAPPALDTGSRRPMRCGDSCPPTLTWEQAWAKNFSCHASTDDYSYFFLHPRSAKWKQTTMSRLFELISSSKWAWFTVSEGRMAFDSILDHRVRWPPQPY